MDTPPDWTLLHAFLRIARAGSLSAAARSGGQSQPTLSRHLKALEARIGQPLLRRDAHGQSLTETGRQVLAEAEAMAEAAARASMLGAAGAPLAGTVRITAARLVAMHYLPAILTRIRSELPQIQLELAPSDSSENLLQREADIALRMFRPETGDLIARQLGALPLGLYASDSYLARRPAPASLAELMAHDFVGFDRSPLLIRYMEQLGASVDRGFFPLRCDDQVVIWELVRQGGGIGALHRRIGDTLPGLTRIAPFLELPSLPVWLVIPAPLRHQPRIARVARLLAEGMAPHLAPA